MKKILLLLILLSQSLFALDLTQKAQGVFPAEKAFQAYVALSDENHGHVLIQISPKHYLYRNKLTLHAIPENALTHWSVPEGIVIQDPYFGAQAIFKNDLDIPFQFNTNIQNLKLEYQGCAESGFCYPPEKKFYRKTETGFELSANSITSEPAAPKALWWLALGFLGLGLALSITPCVLPMVPILCNLLLSQRNNFLSRASVALAYVSGVISAYTMVGMVAAKLGVFIQGLLQQPVVVACSSAVLVLLALWQVELIRLPTQFVKPLKTRHMDKEISLLFAFVMGLVSVAVISPCVTPPLIAALGYISQTGSAAKGALLLAMSGIGLSIPLLLVALFGTGFLPKRGQWMHHVKEALSLGLLAVAISLIVRLVSDSTAHIIWLAYLLLVAAWLYKWKVGKTIRNFAKIIAIVLAFVSITQYSITLNNNHFTHEVTVTNLRDLEKTLANATAHQQWAILDIYADWCTNCREIEANIFENSEVQNKLKNIILIRVDLSVFNQDAQALLKQLNVIAPPTLIFWHPIKGELKNARLIGDISKEDFEKNLEKALQE